MKKSSGFVNITGVLAVLLFFGGCMSALSQTASKKSPNASKISSREVVPAKPVGSGTAHVYLLRGLLNIFSLGMDDLAQKINRVGIASTVHEHGHWQTLADEIAAKYKSGNHGAIVLIGHSLGADAVMLMGEYLGTLGVPVALIVPFDATRSLAANGNVARVMNITQRDYAYMKRGFGFRGELANVDVSRDESIGHISIDKSARLHAMVVNKIVSIVGKGGGVEQSNAPANETSASAPPLPKISPLHDPSAEATPVSPAVIKIASATAAAMYSLSASGGSVPLISSSFPAKEEIPTPSANTDLEFQQLAPRNQN
jgi:hypothetical protein